MLASSLWFSSLVGKVMETLWGMMGALSRQFSSAVKGKESNEQTATQTLTEIYTTGFQAKQQGQPLLH